MESEIIYGELTYVLNGIFFEVHNTLGRCCNEHQYSDAIEERLKKQEIEYTREYIIEPSFEGERAGRNRADFIIANAIVIEVKAKKMVGREDYFQTLRYLAALNYKLGILINFRQHLLRPKRIVNPAAPLKCIRISASSV
ncbi:MAG: GxxExxY protein [Candidatus Uhrbacteria bacterium]